MQGRHFKVQLLVALSVGLWATACSQDRSNPVECHSSENCLAWEFCSDDGECLPDEDYRPDVGERDTSNPPEEDIDPGEQEAVTIEITAENGDDELSLNAGATLQLVATVFDKDGAEISGAQVQWSAQPETILTVTQDGILYGVSDGDAEVSAQSGAASATEPVTVKVPAAGNSAPRANAGDSQTVPVDEVVTLDASASEDDEDDLDALSFSWEILVGPDDVVDHLTIVDADQPVAQFTPEVPGDYVFQVTVTDTGGLNDTDRVTITVEELPDCLIIAQYITGSAENKALSLYNCGDKPLNLGEFGVCIAVNAATSCNEAMGLSGELAAGDVATLCKSKTDSSVVDEIADRCQFVSSKVINHNGDDRFVVYKSADPANPYNAATDTMTDAFGQTAVRPSDTIWQKMTLNRCNFAPYLGVDPFEYEDYYLKSDEQNDASTYGEPPEEGC